MNETEQSNKENKNIKGKKKRRKHRERIIETRKVATVSKETLLETGQPRWSLKAQAQKSKMKAVRYLLSDVICPFTEASWKYTYIYIYRNRKRAMKKT